jgi:hypothetical protein
MNRFTGRVIAGTVLFLLFIVALTAWRVRSVDRLTLTSYFRSKRGIAAEFTAYSGALPLVRVADGTNDYAILHWQNDRWLSTQAGMISVTWNHPGTLIVRAIVPTNRWKLQLRTTTQREIKAGPVHFKFPLSGRTYETEELPSLTEIERTLR